MLGVGIVNPLLVIVMTFLIPASALVFGALVVKTSVAAIRLLGVPGVLPLRLKGAFATFTVLAAVHTCLFALLSISQPAPTGPLLLALATTTWLLFHVWFIERSTRQEKPLLALGASLLVSSLSALLFCLPMWLLYEAFAS